MRFVSTKRAPIFSFASYLLVGWFVKLHRTSSLKLGLLLQPFKPFKKHRKLILLVLWKTATFVLSIPSASPSCLTI